MIISIKKGVLVSLAIFALLGIAAFSYSQEPVNGPGFERGKGDTGKFMMDRMKERLGLSDDQVAKLKPLFISFRSNVSIVMKDKVKNEMDLRDELFIGGSDKDIKPLLDNVYADQAKMADIRKGFFESVKTILSPTQQAKCLMMMKEQGRRGMDRMGRGDDMEEGQMDMMR